MLVIPSPKWLDVLKGFRLTPEEELHLARCLLFQTCHRPTMLAAILNVLRTGSLLQDRE